MTLAFTASDQFAGDPNPNTYYTGADPHVPIPVKKTFKVTDKTMRMTKTTMVSVALVCSLLVAFSVQDKIHRPCARSCGHGWPFRPYKRCRSSLDCGPRSTCCYNFRARSCGCTRFPFLRS
ncbi:uncharacterized protein LOC143028227 isoform X2 [Oratosquilla oratoria]|uniref:uncharacterized protein LOC143028227 isoform X2 n=1 Tax=Oratosquilla oratoria TaxID=337810 RepID=UPI003F76B1D1